jgi:hypothetical protein
MIIPAYIIEKLKKQEEQLPQLQIEEISRPAFPEDEPENQADVTSTQIDYFI